MVAILKLIMHFDDIIRMVTTLMKVASLQMATAVMLVTMYVNMTSSIGTIKWLKRNKQVAK